MANGKRTKEAGIKKQFFVNTVASRLGVGKRKRVEQWYRSLVNRFGTEPENLNFYFTDMFGQMQRTGVGFEEIDDSLFDRGFGIDGSSIRGFQTINVSDQLLFPDLESVFLDVGIEKSSVGVMCSVFDPVPHPHPFTSDPRVIAENAEDRLVKTGIATKSCWGPELEFMLFQHVAWNIGPNGSFYELDHEEGLWNSGRRNNGKANLGYQIEPKRGYYPPDRDTLINYRIALKDALTRNAGIRVENFHHEVASNQIEVDMRFDTLVRMGDHVQVYKHFARQIARQKGLTATFMPKPLPNDNGNGMHVHQSLWNNGIPSFFDKRRKERAYLSEIAEWYIAGLFLHAPAIMAFTNPTVNSFKRLDPGYEAPVYKVWSARNRSAAVRIPVYQHDNPAAKRAEFRIPDPLANPYLAFAVMQEAGTHGIELGRKGKLKLEDPVDEDVYGSHRKLERLPSSLDETLDALEEDNDFLKVVPKEFTQKYIAYKREEIKRVTRPITPAEIAEYFAY